MLLNTSEKRTAQVKKSTNIILNSMRYTVPYVDIKTASKLLKYSDRGTVKCLKRMCEMKLLREHKERTKKNQLMSIFVATKNGREYMPEKWLNKIWTMKNWRLANHHHDMKLHLLFWDFIAFVKKRGFKKIHPEKIDPKGSNRRADFALMINSKTYQIELELTQKSTKRYQSILISCSHSLNDKPFVWVFTKLSILEKVYEIAKKSEYDDRMEFVLWNQENNSFRWIDNQVTPLFSDIQESNKIEEIENPNESYSFELEMELENQRQADYKEIKDFMNKLANTSVFKQRKFLKQVKEKGFNLNHLKS